MSVYKTSKKKIHFAKRKLAFVDIETTGLDSRIHEMIEVAVLITNSKSLKVIKKYHAKIRPEHLETADPKALEINGYNAKDWKKAKPIKKVFSEINKLSPGAMFAGWNVSFDRPFIEQAARQNKILLKFDYHWIDVMTVAFWELYTNKKIEQLKLTHVCEKLGIKLENAHTALADTTATYEVYRYLKVSKKLVSK